MDHRYPKCVIIKSIDFLLIMVYIVMASRVFGATIVICTYIIRDSDATAEKEGDAAEGSARRDLLQLHHRPHVRVRVTPDRPIPRCDGMRRWTRRASGRETGID